MKSFRSNGKLLLTAEYAVLDGAKALALPTKLGQTLDIKELNESKIIWRSLDKEDNIWFEDVFRLEKGMFYSEKKSNPFSQRLLSILNSVNSMNPNFFSSEDGFEITTRLEFAQTWGLGSSSTLINNIANWSQLDPYKLLELTFGGSGYDIACAENDSAIIYELDDDKKARTVTPVSFNPNFKEQLFFVHLNKKQNSREGIRHYNANKSNLKSIFAEINQITKAFIVCSTLNEFENLITNHEALISQLVKLPTIKTERFNDYTGAIKSLGAWGGDFILAAGDVEAMSYFKKKGYQTVISFDDMIK